MATDKKSFVLYTDLVSVARKLIEKDRENKTNYAGELFLHIMEYVNDNDPIAIDFIIEMAFEPIKAQLKRDLIKYEQIKSKRSDAGKRSSELRQFNKSQQDSTHVESVEQNSTNPTSVESVQQSSTNPTVSVNDSVNVNDNVNVFSKENNISLSNACEDFNFSNEVKKVAEEICSWFAVTEISNQTLRGQIYSFAQIRFNMGELSNFSDQFSFYKKYHIESGSRKHLPKGFMENGWNAANWKNTYEDFLKSKKEKPKTIGTDERFSTGTSVQLPITINAKK